MGRRSVPPGQGLGASSAFDLNTDVVANIEVKWLYVEFPLPLVPVDTLLRVGAQPFDTTYKVGVLATGDFAGMNLVTIFTPGHPLAPDLQRRSKAVLVLPRVLSPAMSRATCSASTRRMVP